MSPTSLRRLATSRASDAIACCVGSALLSRLIRPIASRIGLRGFVPGLLNSFDLIREVLFGSLNPTGVLLRGDRLAQLIHRVAEGEW
jgi:hypothetical protein